MSYFIKALRTWRILCVMCLLVIVAFANFAFNNRTVFTLVKGTMEKGKPGNQEPEDSRDSFPLL